MISSWQPVFDKATPPIYRQDQPDRSLFYAPGWVVVVPADIVSGFQAALADPRGADWPEASQLRDHAIEAQQNWENLQADAFVPLCLTLYLNNACNLSCVYCFSQPYRSKQPRLSPDAICAAAEIVAANCCARQRPLTVAFHGGGEPTLDYPLIRQTLEVLQRLAARDHIDLFRYIATNGILSQARASDLTNCFDLVGLSCDGPPELQDRQRPLREGNQYTSSWFVERTARQVHLAGKPLHVRATITPETMDGQAEIAEYICQTLKPQEIHVEPVYAIEGDGIKGRFQPAQAERYVRAFLHARQIARGYGISWSTSGSRPAEIHSGYCHIWRNVLNLTPEGTATACFKLSDANSARRESLDLGEWDARGRHFELNSERVQELRQSIQAESEECALCFNHHHCVRDCPDVCILKSGSPSGGFRCRVQSLLTGALIREAAETLWSDRNRHGPVMGRVEAI